MPELELEEKCENCGGSGIADGALCFECDGAGVIMTAQGEKVLNFVVKRLGHLLVVDDGRRK